MAFSQPEEKTRYTRKYDVFNNMEHRRIIKDFVRDWGDIGFFPTLVKMGLARYSERYQNGVIDGSRLQEVNDVQEKMFAINDLIKMGEYAEKQEKLKLEPLYNKIALNK